MSAVVPPFDVTLLHLEAELARIDLLVRRYAASRTAALPSPAGTSQDENWDKLYAQASQAVTAVLDAAQHAGQLSRLAGVVHAFELTPFDYDVFLIALAPVLDAHYGRFFGVLLDDLTLRYPTVGLVLDLLGVAGVERLQRLLHFTERGTLLKHHLLEMGSEPGILPTSLIDCTLAPDPTIVTWLLGDYQPAAQLGAYARLSVSYDNSTDAAMCAALWPSLVDAMHGQTITCFYGADVESQAAAARLIAAGMQSPLLAVDLKGVLRMGTPAQTAVRLALRDARLTGAIVYLSGMDGCLVEKAPPPEVQQELFNHSDLVITSSAVKWRPAGVEDRREILWQEFPLPSLSQRAHLWRHFLGEQADEETLNPEFLAGLFYFNSGQIRDTVLDARDRVLARGDQRLQREDLLAAARANSGSKLEEWARKIVPRHSWADLVLRPDQIASLQEILATVRRRSQVLEGWGIGKKLASSAAVTILFAGEPGTGKTMAAEVIAGELGLELYKIDLSSLVSKYIGETEKNLEQIFKEAEQGNAILFFDEADALFGKRSGIKDAHDRYANIGVSYLLQRVESYDGITILATNLRSNLDDAFIRRLQYLVDFPFPDEGERLRIWQALFPLEIPRAPDVDFAMLAKRYSLSGGNIRNIIVAAAFHAAEQQGPVKMEHLLHGVRREYQKLGRLINEGELQLAPPPERKPVSPNQLLPIKFQRTRRR